MGERAENKAAYDADIANKTEALRILAQATEVLQKFYEQNEGFQKLKGGSFIQQAPEVLEYDTRKGGGKVIGMLKTITSETETEIETANKEEKESIADYDAMMADLKATQKDLEKT